MSPSSDGARYCYIPQAPRTRALIIAPASVTSSELIGHIHGLPEGPVVVGGVPGPSEAVLSVGFAGGPKMRYMLPEKHSTECV